MTNSKPYIESYYHLIYYYIEVKRVGNKVDITGNVQNKLREIIYDSYYEEITSAVGGKEYILEEIEQKDNQQKETNLIFIDDLLMQAQEELNKLICNKTILARGNIIEGFVFNGYKFTNCNFISIEFNRCSLEQFVLLNNTFTNCRFNNTKIELCFFNFNIFINTKFEGCEIKQGSFYKNIHANTVFFCNGMNDSDFHSEYFYSIEFKNCELIKVLFNSCTFAFTKINLDLIMDSTTRFNDIIEVSPSNLHLITMFFVELESCFRRCPENPDFSALNSLFDSENSILIKNEKKLKGQISQNIMQLYFSLDTLAYNNNCRDLFGKYYYLAKKRELKNCKFSLKKIIMLLNYLTIGFGEKPFRTFLISSLGVLFFAIAYMINGLNITGMDNTKFGTYLHFSIVTFTTVGYGNITPIGPSIVLSSLEMIFGVIMIALFTGTILRKMTR
jgi:uncharacterized protein YjbI with pentapeptide repeats